MGYHLFPYRMGIKMDRILNSAVITGPTGAIGTALCRELARNHIQVYAVCRPGSSRVSEIPVDDHVQIIYCDISELTTLKEKIQSADAFFHFAWAHTIGPGSETITLIR